MPASFFHLRPTVVATLLALNAAVALAQTTATQPAAAVVSSGGTLSTVTVEASADASAEGLTKPYAGGQVSRGGRVGILGNQDMMSTPFSSTNYTNELIQDQQAKSVADVLLNDPSVRQARGFGNFQELYVVRGFPVYSDDVAYNGLYGMLPRQYIASEFFERVEVFRGANTFLNGAAPGGSGIGGAINLLPKRAPNEPLTRVGFGVQTGGQGYVNLDLARRFGPGDSLGVRVNAVRREGGTGVKNESQQLSAFNVGLDWHNRNVRLSADFGYQDYDLKDGRPSLTPSSTLPIPRAPDARTNFAQPWTYSKEKDKFATFRGEVDITDNITAWAAGGPGRDVVGDVDLAAEGGELVLFLRIGPGLGEVGAGVGRARDRQRRRGRQARASVFQVVVLIAEVGRQAHVAVVPVEADVEGAELLALVLHAGAAFAAHRVHAHAQAVAGAEAARQVEVDVALAAGLHAEADAGERLVGRALGQQVDRTADAAAAGRCAVQEGVGAAEDFHALEEFRSDVLARQHAVQAVVGDVVGVHGEAAHHVQLLEVAEAASLAHRRIVEQHVGHALGLLVLDQLVGVVGAGKRRAHHVLVAQDADPAAARHLSAGVGFGQALGRGVGAGFDGHGGQRAAARNHRSRRLRCGGLGQSYRGIQRKQRCDHGRPEMEEGSGHERFNLQMRTVIVYSYAPTRRYFLAMLRKSVSRKTDSPQFPTRCPSTNTCSSPGANCVHVSLVVSGEVTTTATRSLGVVCCAKSISRSSSDNCAVTKGWRRSTYQRLVEACAHSACPLDSMKLKVPWLASCGANSRSVSVSSSMLGTPACDLASSCMIQQKACSLSVLPTGWKLPCRRGRNSFRSPLWANTQ